jgi:hypothetical protein
VLEVYAFTAAFPKHETYGQYWSLKVLVCWGTRGLSRVCSG